MALREKLVQVREAKRSSQIDWKKRRDSWISEVDKLYGEIGGWFADLLAANHLTISYEKKRIVEEYLGEYEISVMELDLEVYPAVKLEPMGRNIINALGRIDLYLKGHQQSDKNMLLLMEREDSQPEWELWRTGYQQKVLPFSQDNFEQLLEYWMDAWA